MGERVGVYVADLTENVLVYRHGGVYDEGAAGADALGDVNADLSKAGVEADDAVRTVDVALYFDRLIGDAAVGVDRSALAFRTVLGDGLSELDLNDGGVGQYLGSGNCALTAAGIESEFPHDSFVLLFCG